MKFSHWLISATRFVSLSWRPSPRPLTEVASQLHPGPPFQRQETIAVPVFSFQSKLGPHQAPY